MSWILTYILLGVAWNIILDFIGYVSKSENTLNNYEKIFSIVLWPIVLIIFSYHFIKTLFE
jgi:hypothetical protein